MSLFYFFTIISTRYVIDIGTVTDEDVAKPDFTDYRFIEAEDEELQIFFKGSN